MVEFSDGDIRPEVRAGRAMNHRYDITAEPLAHFGAVKGRDVP
jgi:hypothetical protein